MDEACMFFSRMRHRFASIMLKENFFLAGFCFLLDNAFNKIEVIYLKKDRDYCVNSGNRG